MSAERDSTREVIKIDLAELEGQALREAETRHLPADVEDPDASAGGGLPPPEPLQAPPKYRLERCLGQGGFGVVWLARDLDLARPVALKFLTHADAAEVARFRREARFAAALNHPAVVEVYELGFHAGRYFIAQEFLEGGNLEEAGFGPRRLAEALLAVATALAAAHARGIVHRDIKPENILLDAVGQAHVTDFGAAADLHREPEEEGTVIGTPDLMAPEQARGEMARIDGRTDVYALGVTLYSLLTKTRPFARPTLLLTLTAVLRDTAPCALSIDPSIPAPLAAIAERCMHKARGARYPTMQHVADALRRYLDGEELSSEGVPLPATRDFDPVALALDASHTLGDWDRVRGRSAHAPSRDPLLALHARLTATLRAHPDQAWVRFLRGQTATRLGRVVSGLDDMERSVDRLAGQAWAQRELGELYLRLALAEQEQPARELSFVSGMDHLEVTRGYLEQARVCFEQAELTRPGTLSWHVPFALALDAYAGRDPHACLEQVEALLAREPDLPWAWRLKGRALEAEGEDPRESYRAALAVRHGDASTLLALGEADLERGDVDAAEHELEQALRSEPYDAAILCARACVHLVRVEDCSPSNPCRQTLTHLRHARDGAPLPLELRRELLGEDREQSRPLVEAAWIEVALRSLDETQHDPEGQTVRARALLMRAQHALRHGEDPRPDLDAILRGWANDLAQTTQPWLELLGAAWRAR